MQKPMQGNRKAKKNSSSWDKTLKEEMMIDRRQRKRELNKSIRHLSACDIFNGNYYRKTNKKFQTMS